uniref:DUF3883 domain-containing protein n=1 Tax=Meloidogyne hapla TaxID=6305 RepID=A0A1I8BKV2_MELHA
MIGEIKTENAKQNSALKEIIEQKDEKIISLVKQCFVHVANKWKEFDLSNCCINKCINTENPIGKCIKGNGFANIINDANIEYIEWFKKKGCFGGYDKYSYIFAENSFNKPKEDFNNYSLFYYEIKSKTDEEDKNRRIEIGLKNSKDNYVKLTIGVNYSSINYKIEKKKNSSNSIGNIPLNNNLSMDWRLIEKIK